MYFPNFVRRVHAPLWRTGRSEVQRPLVAGQRRFVYRLPTASGGRGRCAPGLPRRAPNSIATTPSEISSEALAPMMCTPRMRSVCAQASILTKPVGSPMPSARPLASERDLADLVGDAVGLELLLGLADPGDFRAGVDHPGDGVEIAVTGLAGHQLGDHDALFHAPCAPASARARRRRPPRRPADWSGSGRRPRSSRARRVAGRPPRR